MRRNNNQTLIIVLLVVAIAGLGIGFASFSRTLTISSSAAVNPNADDFKVVLSGSSSSNTTSVIPTLSATGVTNFTGGTATISSDGLSITGLKANFTEPDQKVTYTFYARNTGKYIAYRNNLVFNNISGQSVRKKCTPGTGADATMVASACNGIDVIFSGNDGAFMDNLNDGRYRGCDRVGTDKGDFEKHQIIIEYSSTASRVDGPFTVSFGDISVEYGTVTTCTGSGTAEPV